MSKFVLLVTLLLEVLLAATRFIANSLKKNDKYGGERTETLSGSGGPPSTSGAARLLDLESREPSELELKEMFRHSTEKEISSPKVDDSHSGDV